MKAHVIEYNADGASNGGHSEVVLCMDQKVHVRLRECWHETWGISKETQEECCWDVAGYDTEIGPCTCGSGPEVELSAKHAALVQTFLRTSEPIVISEDTKWRKEEDRPDDYVMPLIYDQEAGEYHYTEEVSKIPGKNRFSTEFYFQRERG